MSVDSKRLALYYKALGATAQSTEAEIIKNYKQKIISDHPDVNKRPDASEKFTLINEAYTYLIKNKGHTKKIPVDEEYQNYSPTQPKRHHNTFNFSHNTEFLETLHFEDIVDIFQNLTTFNTGGNPSPSFFNLFSNAFTPTASAPTYFTQYVSFSQLYNQYAIKVKTKCSTCCKCINGCHLNNRPSCRKCPVLKNCNICKNKRYLFSYTIPNLTQDKKFFDEENNIHIRIVIEKIPNRVRISLDKLVLVVKKTELAGKRTISFPELNNFAVPCQTLSLGINSFARQGFFINPFERGPLLILLQE
jgi:hypothetical protein